MKSRNKKYSSKLNITKLAWGIFFATACVSACTHSKKAIDLEKQPLLPFIEKIAPSIQPNPTPEPATTVINIQSKITKEVIHTNETCLKNNVIPEQIHFPTDLTVSKDGKTLYMLTSYCQNLPKKPTLNATNDVCIDDSSAPQGEKFTYKLKAENNFKPELILADKEPILGCRVKEIEATEDGKTLFLNDVIDYRIHQYDGSLSTLVEGYGVSPHGFLGLYSPNKDTRVFWSIPQYLKIKENTLLYRQIANAGMESYYHTREFDLQTRQQKDRYCNLTSNGQGFRSAKLSVFYGGQAYFLDLTDAVKKGSGFIYLERAPENQGKCRVNNPPFTYFITPPDKSNKYQLKGMAVDSQGNIYLSDTITNSIYKVVFSENKDDEYGVSLKAYTNSSSGYQDGNISEAQFNTPTTLVIDGQDNIYVADTGNHAIRKITPDGNVSTIFKQNIP